MATLRQKKAADKVAENGGNIGAAMRDAGYSVISSKTPKKLTASKGWEELMGEYLPDSLLAEKHQELLTVPKIIRTTKRGEFVDQEESTDVQAISKGLDMAYKLKGRYAPEKHEHKVEDVTPDERIQALAKRLNAN